MTAIELITRDDLKQFKSELLDEIKKIMKPGSGESKQWLKSVEVRKMLSISPGTLQCTINWKISINCWKVNEFVLQELFRCECIRSESIDSEFVHSKKVCLCCTSIK
jgi:hypothetical protein